MKKISMPRLLSAALALLVTVSSTIAFPVLALAADEDDKEPSGYNLKLIGTGDGLRIEPDNKQMFDYFFNLVLSTPGDFAAARLDINNKGANSFLLNVKVEDSMASERDPDANLIDQLVIEVYRLTFEDEEKTVVKDEEKLTDFPVKENGERDLDYTLPWKISPDDEAITLELRVMLPGEETGNEFMDKGAALRWTFETRPDTGSVLSDSWEGEREGVNGRRDRVRSGGGSVVSGAPDATANSSRIGAVSLAADVTPLGAGGPGSPGGGVPGWELTLLDEATPLGAPKEMPQTGEMSLMYGLSGGALLIGAGLSLLRKKDDNNDNKEEKKQVLM